MGYKINIKKVIFIIFILVNSLRSEYHICNFDLTPTIGTNYKKAYLNLSFNSELKHIEYGTIALYNSKIHTTPYFAFSGIFNKVSAYSYKPLKTHSFFLQSSLFFNSFTGRVKTIIQLSPFINHLNGYYYLHNFTFQFGSINGSDNEIKGAQIGIFNGVFRKLSGLQFGLLGNVISKKHSSKGCQIGGLINFGALSGFQISGLTNISSINGIQISPINIDYLFSKKRYGQKNQKIIEHKHSIQIGIINYSNNHNNGLQIGLVNYNKLNRNNHFGLFNLNPNNKILYSFSYTHLGEAEYTIILQDSILYSGIQLINKRRATNNLIGYFKGFRYKYFFKNFSYIDFGISFNLNQNIYHQIYIRIYYELNKILNIFIGIKTYNEFNKLKIFDSPHIKSDFFIGSYLNLLEFWRYIN